MRSVQIRTTWNDIPTGLTISFDGNYQTFASENPELNNSLVRLADDIDQCQEKPLNQFLNSSSDSKSSSTATYDYGTLSEARKELASAVEDLKDIRNWMQVISSQPKRQRLDSTSATYMRSVRDAIDFRRTQLSPTMLLHSFVSMILKPFTSLRNLVRSHLNGLDNGSKNRSKSMTPSTTPNTSPYIPQVELLSRRQRNRR